MRFLMILMMATPVAWASSLPASQPIPGRDAAIHFEVAPLPGKTPGDLRPLNTRQLTSLRVTFADKQGRLHGECRLAAFDARMPAHNHGMSLVARIENGEKLGEFFVRGVKLHMAGTWELSFTTECEGKSAPVTFLIEV